METQILRKLPERRSIRIDSDVNSQNRVPEDHAPLNPEISPARSLGPVKTVPTHTCTQCAPVSPTRNGEDMREGAS